MISTPPFISRLTRSAVLGALAVALGMLGSSLPSLCPCTETYAVVTGHLNADPPNPQTSIAPETWRYTRLGWQDLSHWTPRPDVAPTGLDRLNPWGIALAILMVAFAALFWASEEWEVERFLHGPDAVCRRRTQRNSNHSRRE